MDQQYLTVAKIPVLDTGKFEQWQFQKQQYLQHKHYALWEVIEFGDSYVVPVSSSSTTTTDTTSDEYGSKSRRTVRLTAKDMQKKKNDVKARTTLLLSLPDEHQLRFSKYKTARELWAAILKTFDGNEATKKTKKNLLKQQYGNFKAEGSETLEQTFNKLQVIVGQLQFMDIEIEQNDLNQKFLTSLAPEWLMHTIVWRNRSDLDTMSLDDLYNHLNENEDGNTACVPTASTNVPTASVSVATISQDTACAYIASQSNCSQIKFEDINQIDEDDMEEMDIKWNMAFLSMRADKFWKKTGKRISIQGSDMAGFDKSKVECFNCHKMGHFARECRAPRNQDRGRRDNYRQGSKAEEQAPKALMVIDGVGWDWSYMENDEKYHALVADELAPIEFALMANTSAESKVFNNSLCSKDCLLKASKDLNNLIESQRSDKIKEGLGYSVVPLPPAQHYLSPKKDLSWTGLPECADDTATDYSGPSPTVESTSGDDQNRNSSVFETVPSPITPKPFIKFVKPKDSQSKSKSGKTESPKKPLVKNFPPVNRKFSTGSRNFPSANRKFHITSRKFPTDSTKCSTADMGMKGKAVKPSACWFWKPSQSLSNKGQFQNNIDDKGYWDSSCSRHMAGNISYLFDYEPFDGGYVSFGQGGCKITGKETIKTGKLEFENVYFVKELKCDNRGEFRNKEMNDFCSQKRIKREFSNARTPQQNGIAERRNKTLIEAARTMLAEAKLPVTFWAKAVNTACYVQNRALVNKSHNKTPYELFNGRSPTIGFLKPFGCHVMNLNTLDNLGKFEEKGDEGIKDAASQEVKKNVSSLRYITLSNQAHDALLEFSSSKPQDHCSTEVPECSENPNPTASTSNPPADQMETLIVETLIPTVSSPVPTAYSTDSQEPSSDARLISKRVANQVETPSLDNILSLTNRFEDILRVTTNSDESNGVAADISNMETAITASHTPTLRIHKDHPKSQIIGLMDTLIQTRNKSKEEEGIDYDEVFSPVARIEAIRLFLAYASFMGFTVYQMDVKSAFLYGDILKKSRYSDVRSSNTPMDKENPWGKDETGKDVDMHLYRSMIGSLMYLTASRPNIIYLKSHPKLGLWYPKESPFDLVAYSDSDYGGATQDRKSTTGGCQFLGRRLILWQCKKQTIVATSTTEAEYGAATSCCGQVLWIQNQLLDYGLSMPCEALSMEFSISILRL
nr:retrovirus-related Pol polyprotein from transposon TNT 1-94 [Tanacetum cinerariifolium]